MRPLDLGRAVLSGRRGSTQRGSGGFIGERGHVFWCDRGYRTTADCTCETLIPYGRCRCGHTEGLHGEGEDRWCGVLGCGCAYFTRPIRFRGSAHVPGLTKHRSGAQASGVSWPYRRAQ